MLNRTDTGYQYSFKEGSSKWMGLCPYYPIYPELLVWVFITQPKTCHCLLRCDLSSFWHLIDPLRDTVILSLLYDGQVFPMVPLDISLFFHIGLLPVLFHLCSPPLHPESSSRSLQLVLPQCQVPAQGSPFP